jgi:hypothetical protein
MVADATDNEQRDSGTRKVARFDNKRWPTKIDITKRWTVEAGPRRPLPSIRHRGVGNRTAASDTAE